ncbi:TPA: DNA-directed RNA polymerase subunit beta [Streptococcus suis]|nr:DNA-directed RNA polymerase subunit beta [Streptococcus suis]
MNKEELRFVGRQLLIVVLVAVLAVIVFSLGLMIGYGVIGDGDSMWDILSLEKWQELISKFTGK